MSHHPHDRFRSFWMAALLLAVTAMPAAAQTGAASWVGTWATAPVRDDAASSFTRQTLRQVICTSVGGSSARIHISNLFGTRPLRVEDVHIARLGDGSSILPDTDRAVLFRGSRFIVIAPGKEAVSDPVAFQVPALSDIAISFCLPRPSGRATFHGAAHQTSYLASGDVSSSKDLSDAKTTESTWFLTGLDVQGAGLHGAVVTLGASITEGYFSTPGANRRWPNVLAQKLVEAGFGIGVLNEGISGNRLLADGAGASARHRFRRDVLELPGVRWVIFADAPINDLGSTKPQPSAAQLIAGIGQLIALAHQSHIQFFCSTLTPYEGANYWTPAGEAARERVNDFLRSEASGCDAVIDQDAATHDPAHPTRFLPAYDHGDHLHPNDAGLQAIAGAVNLALFTQASGRDGMRSSPSAGRHRP
ncbi:SGNH/GDSL hydrolase family protein [Paracidobacterium acidisoli]|nr:SGNH/GDSL hydrolase family protein [Paracidobacterium acidisoli]MBT9332433.1 SGNH/GDSL hydrolase family protein [Paracidobacterium acidisoli]